jgi:O-antigen ligase
MSSTRRKIHEQIFSYSCLALVFFMPIYGKIIPSIISLMFLNWLIEGRFMNIPSVFRDRNRLLTFSFAAIYLLYLLGMLYSTNLDYGFFDLQVKLSLFIFPLIFATIDKNFFFQKLVSFVFRAFVAGCVTAALLLFGIAVYSYLDTGNTSVFFYTSFSRFIHVSYLSMYLNLAISILCFSLISRGHPMPRWNRVLFIILIVYLSFVIFLLSSKAGIFSLLFLFLLIILYILVINRQVWRGIMLFLLVILTFSTLFTFLPSITQRFKNTETVLTDKNNSSVEKKESNSERLVVWKAGIEVIRKHPVFGVGTGDVKDALMAEYKKENKLVVYNMRLNAHNQYLQTYIALGVLGLLFLMVMLILPAWMSIRKTHVIYFSFLAVFAINILVESMLEVQAGVVFYAFFNSLFFFGLKSLTLPDEDAERA